MVKEINLKEQITPPGSPFNNKMVEDPSMKRTLSKIDDFNRAIMQTSKLDTCYNQIQKKETIKNGNRDLDMDSCKSASSFMSNDETP